MPREVTTLHAINRRSRMCINKLCGRPPRYAPSPYKLTFDLLTLKVVSDSRVTCAQTCYYIIGLYIDHLLAILTH